MWPVIIALGAVGAAIFLLSKPSKATPNETPIAAGGASGKIGGSASGIVEGGKASGTASGGASGSVNLGGLAEKIKEAVGDVKVTLPVVALPATGEIATTPTPGKWYEIKDSDNGGTFVAIKAYPGKKPLPAWYKVVQNATNQAAPLNGGGNDTGDRWFLPRWNGKGSAFGSGHRYAVIYIPVL